MELYKCSYQTDQDNYIKVQNNFPAKQAYFMKI